MGLFVGLWVAQIAVSILILTMVAKRDDMSEKIAGYRDAAIKVGFLPCGGLMLFAQAGQMGMYYFAVAREDAKRKQLQGHLTATGFDSVASSQQPSATLQPGANPFASEDAPVAQPAPSAPPAAGPPSDNPFG